MTRPRIVLAAGVSVYLLGMAFACGMTVERIRFDQRRTTVLTRYDDAIREWHQLRMLSERQAAAPTPNGG